MSDWIDNLTPEDLKRHAELVKDVLRRADATAIQDYHGRRGNLWADLDRLKTAVAQKPREGYWDWRGWRPGREIPRVK